jgi:hypothetical protein
MKDVRRMNLGESHKRAVDTVLFLLDEMLCDFEAYAKGRELHGLLYHERNRLSPGQRQAILAEIDRIRSVMKELQAAFGLEPRVEDVLQNIWGRGSAFWEDLVETEAKYLRRYGEMPAGVGEYLDPRIEAIIERLEAITRIASGKRPGYAPDPHKAQDKP